MTRIMSRPPPPRRARLKVYQAAFGFHDSVVAAPNQAAALEAWGVRQNLFAEGYARLSDDAEAVEAALAHPRTPLRRAVGSKDPFVLTPGLPELPAANPLSPHSRAGHGTSPPPMPKPVTSKPDRSALDAAEAEMAALERDHGAAEADFRARRDALDAEWTETHRRWTKRRSEAEHRLRLARRAFERSKDS